MAVIPAAPDSVSRFISGRPVRRRAAPDLQRRSLPVPLSPLSSPIVVSPCGTRYR